MYLKGLTYYQSNEIVTKGAWGKDVLEFNPDRFNGTTHHAYQEAFIEKTLSTESLSLRRYVRHYICEIWLLLYVDQSY